MLIKFIFGIVLKNVFKYLLWIIKWSLPRDTVSNLRQRKPSVTSDETIWEDSVERGFKKNRVKSGGRFSPRKYLQCCNNSGAFKPLGISKPSSCESELLIFGAELNEPILKGKQQIIHITDWNHIIKQNKSNIKTFSSNLKTSK